ncbi:hypothetical protein HHK36_030691 [Tetracentron sinense]|uniref:AB hydrolase-1 domain-containing protein n=1 Tax=Tetracentron sinense TaxID=13715 RepID=A0A834Y892_TETSI|nr:hypothetical protein HHK36_030691 [Tetracentron sinense]
MVIFGCTLLGSVASIPNKIPEKIGDWLQSSAISTPSLVWILILTIISLPSQTPLEFLSVSCLMGKCFSFTALRNWCYRRSFANSGLRSTITDLGDGTVMHCWVPKTHKENKPTLLLVHGFGANAMWQWNDLLGEYFISHFNIYVPDLLFFGDSVTTRPERTESFQAQCVMRVMEAHGVSRMILIGISYGGLVGYSLASQFPDAVERLVLCCAGVCLEEKDAREGQLKVWNSEEAESILLPQTPEKARELMQYSFFKPLKIMPSCFLRDFIDVMCTEYAEEKRELIRALHRDRNLSDLPKISQPTLLIWGEHDQIFPLELGHRLKRHMGENALLVIIKNAGHAVIMEKPKEFYKHLKEFLVDSFPPKHRNEISKID